MKRDIEIIGSPMKTVLGENQVQKPTYVNTFVFVYQK